MENRTSADSFDDAQNTTLNCSSLRPTRIAMSPPGPPGLLNRPPGDGDGFFMPATRTETAPIETVTMPFYGAEPFPDFSSIPTSTIDGSAQLSYLVPHPTSTDPADITPTSSITDDVSQSTARTSFLRTTLQTSTAKQAPSVVIGPPVSAPSTSASIASWSPTSSTDATTTQPERGSPSCSKDPTCAAEADMEAHRRGLIAGSVVAVVAALVLIFGLYMFCRKKLNTPVKRKEDPGWVEVKPPRKPFLIEKTRPMQKIASEDTQGDVVQLQDRPPSAGRVLGEPGPAVVTEKHQQQPEYTVVPSTKRLSNTSMLSDPFRTPDDSLQLNQSQIGLALSRYSSTIDRPLPTPPQQHLTPIPRAINEEDALKRASSFTTQTEDTDKENEPRTLFIGTAQPTKFASARRHSLTPRIVNIIAGSGSRDRVQADGADESSGDEGPSKRSTIRARSSSPMKSSKLYSGSPAKLNHHFGIKTCSQEVGRTSSELLRHARDGSDDSMAGRGRPRLRKSDQVVDEGHVSYPPTSFPLLGRTLSESKRKLRDSDGTSSSHMTDAKSVPALPETVTIDRGGKRKR